MMPPPLSSSNLPTRNLPDTVADAEDWTSTVLQARAPLPQRKRPRRDSRCNGGRVGGFATTTLAAIVLWEYCLVSTAVIAVDLRPLCPVSGIPALVFHGVSGKGVVPSRQRPLPQHGLSLRWSKTTQHQPTNNVARLVWCRGGGGGGGGGGRNNVELEEHELDQENDDETTDIVSETEQQPESVVDQDSESPVEVDDAIASIPNESPGESTVEQQPPLSSPPSPLLLRTTTETLAIASIPPLYKFLLRQRGPVWHVVLMAMVVLVEWTLVYLPMVASAWAWFWTVLARRFWKSSDDDDDGSRRRSGNRRNGGPTKLSKRDRADQLRRADEAAWWQLQQLAQNPLWAKYRHVTAHFVTRHGLGKTASASQPLTTISTGSGSGHPKEALRIPTMGQTAGTAAAKSKHGPPAQSDQTVDWIVQALTSTTAAISTTVPRLILGGSPRRHQRNVAAIVDAVTTAAQATTLSTSTASASLSSSTGTSSSTSNSALGLLGRLDPTRLSRSLLGAYPGDAVPPSEAASAHGVTELAQRYGWGDWNDEGYSFEEGEHDHQQYEKDSLEEGEQQHHGEDDEDDDNNDDGTDSFGNHSQDNDTPPRRIRRMAKPKRRVRKKRTKVIMVERDDSTRGFSIGFDTGVDQGNEWTMRSRRRRLSRQSASASRTTTQTSTTSDSNGPSSLRSKSTLNNMFTSITNADETKPVRDRRPRDAPLAHSWTLGHSNVRSTPRSPLPTTTSTASDDSNGPSSSPRSNAMLHSIFTSSKNNASETKSTWARPRDAPLAHSMTLSRRSNIDSTPRSPLLSLASAEEPRTMIRPALELLLQKRREQDQLD
jgi:hypothetical protein